MTCYSPKIADNRIVTGIAFVHKVYGFSLTYFNNSHLTLRNIERLCSRANSRWLYQQNTGGSCTRISGGSVRGYRYNPDSIVTPNHIYGLFIGGTGDSAVKYCPSIVYESIVGQRKILNCIPPASLVTTFRDVKTEEGAPRVRLFKIIAGEHTFGIKISSDIDAALKILSAQ
jgi:hypothetical protein